MGTKTEDKKGAPSAEETKSAGALVAQTGGTDLAAINDELLADAGAGTSQAADDNILPFYVLLQDMSPEVKKRDPDYVDGAEPGMIMNRATKKLYAGDDETAERTGLPRLRFQHCFFDRAIVEWVPRNDGGGFVARHELHGTPEQTMERLGARQVPDPQDPNKKIWRSSDGKNDMIDTRYHFGHSLEVDGTIQPGVIAFSSTGHTASREWMTMMNSFKVKAADGRLLVAPSWAKGYIVGSKPKTNTKGDFFVFSVSDAGVIADAGIRAAGKELNASVGSGAVRASTDEGGAAGAAGAAGDEPF